MYDALTTARLVLRPWQKGDAEALYAYASDPLVGPAAGWPHHENLETSRAVLERFMQQGSDWALTDRETGRILGSLGLSPDRRRAEGVLSLGYALARESWGRGLATEAARAALGYAFGPLHARLVTVYHFPFNHASRRVIEKCGFRLEGVFRQSFRRYDGLVLDEVTYSMTPEEYAGAKEAYPHDLF